MLQILVCFCKNIWYNCIYKHNNYLLGTMKNKKHYESLKSNYNKIPSQVNRLGLSIFALGLFQYLVSLPEEADPGKGFIGKMFGYSRQTVSKWYKELEARGIIKCYTKGGLNRVTKYEFTNPKGWIINK